MDLPLLLPKQHTEFAEHDWKPSKFLSGPQPPPADDVKLTELEMLANARQLDGKLIIKKTRPRRTVDYNGGMGRWALMRKLRPNPSYVPHLRPSPPYIVDLMPPKAYPENSSTSLCTKFVHTSTNKIRCPVNVVTWTPESRRILTGSTSGEFTLWNGLTFNFETILQAHDTAICTFQFTHNGAFLASADKSGVIKYFEPNMNNLTAWQGSSSKEAIRGISFSPDDQRFATASDDASVRIWSFQESRVEKVFAGPTGHGWDVKCVEWHPTKGLLVSGSKDNKIIFWDPRSGTPLTTLHQHKNTVQALAWSPNGHMVASASRDQTVRVFDIRTLKEFRILKGHKKEVCSVTWHPVHPILVSGGSEGAILHWDLAAPEPPYNSSLPPRATLSQAHDSNVWSLAFHPLGHLLVSGSNDHTTRFWSRERPGDASSVFSGGGEKPPEVADTSGQDEDDELMVPGFGYAGAGSGAWSREDHDNPNVEFDGFPKFGGGGSGGGGGGSGGGGGFGDQNPGDDFIPGFGATAEYTARYQQQQQQQQQQRQASIPPPRDDDWHRGRDRDYRDRDDDWNRRDRDRDRNSRWGSRRNDRGSRY